MDTDSSLPRRLFDQLRAATSDGVGISRESYGQAESAALDIVEAEAQSQGLATKRDAGANLVVTLPGRDAALPFLACGSHLDSVPQGGNYDGAAGPTYPDAPQYLDPAIRRGTLPPQRPTRSQTCATTSIQSGREK